MTKPWKLILLLAGIFIAGGVTGAFVAARIENGWFGHRPPPEQWASLHLKKLTEKLDLKPEQADQLLPIIRRNRDEFNKARAQCQVEIKAVIERMEREISEKLTPDQLPKYEKFVKEMHERAKKFVPDRKPHPPGPGAPPPEPPPAEKP